MISYRRDIDGLRAVAVLSVVLFHIDSSLLPGGFIGVDIFFVISGFLITGIITKGLEAGSFSFLEFYRRRIKRIIPVLTVVILSTLVVAQFILLPEDLLRLSSSAIASQLFFANIYFTYFLDTSYFADDAALQPLLHLWSLGVEEQFYLLWPAILVFGLYKFKNTTFLLSILTLAIFSFVLGEMLLSSSPMFAYYMLPARAGELLVGALCFFLTQVKRESDIPRAVIEILSWAGFGLILFSLVWISEDLGFPGLNAIPVTMGTALLIFSGSRTPTFLSRVLSTPPVVAVGLISYSMYLWHWPLLAFVKYIYTDLTILQESVSFFLIVVLSVLSYQYVEKPFKGDKRNFPTIVIKQFIVPSAVIMLICGLIIGSSGYGLYYFDHKYRVDIRTLIEKAQPAYKYEFVCQSYHLTANMLTKPECIIGGADEPTVLLWGDSNAAYFIGALGELAKEYGFSFRNAVHSSCPPIIHNPQRFVPNNIKQSCGLSNKEVTRIIDDYDTVILAGAWNSHLGRNKDMFVEAMQKSVSELVNSGKLVILMGRVPPIQSFDRDCGLKSLKIGNLDCSERTQVSRKRVQEVNSTIENIARLTGARYFDVNDVLCTGDLCSGILDGQLVYHDPGHLSMGGSILVGTHLKGDENAFRIFSDIKGNGVKPENPLLPWESNTVSWLENLGLNKKDLIFGAEEFLAPSNWSGNKPQLVGKSRVLRFEDQDNNSYQFSVFKFGEKLTKMHVNAKNSDYVLFVMKFQQYDLNFPFSSFVGLMDRSLQDILHSTKKCVIVM